MNDAPDDPGGIRITQRQQPRPRHPAGACHRAAHGKAPDQEVDQKYPLDPAPQPMDPPFQQGRPRRHLPPGQPLIQRPLQQGARRRRPEHRHAQR